MIFKVQGSSEITSKILWTKAKYGDEKALIESSKLNYKMSGKGKNTLLGIGRHGSLMFLLISQTEVLTTYISDCLFFIV